MSSEQVLNQFKHELTADIQKDDLCKFLDPISILFIVSALLSIYCSCLRIWNPTAAQAQAEVMKWNRIHPKSLRRRMKKIALREHPTLTEEQADVFVETIINKALTANDVTTLFASIPSTPVAPEEDENWQMFEGINLHDAS